jgi:hypothetical protein
MSPVAPLYFVFTIRDNDILNCRMATYSRQKAEDECRIVLVALRGNDEDNWVRIVSFPCTFSTGTRVWVSLEDNEEATDVEIVSVEDQEELISQGAGWVDDVVIV